MSETAQQALAVAAVAIMLGCMAAVGLLEEWLDKWR